MSIESRVFIDKSGFPHDMPRIYGEALSPMAQHTAFPIFTDHQ